MVRLTKRVSFFYYYIFRKENLLIHLLTEKIHKTTHKMFIKHSQNASRKCTLDLCTLFEFTIIDQDE